MAEIAGLKLIVPTSVTTGSGTVTVSASGKITFTTAQGFSVNGCFTSAYDNYLLVYGGTNSGPVALQMRLRASGTDNSTSNAYTNQELGLSNTTIAAARFAQTYGYFSYLAATKSGVHAYIYGPNLAQPTAFRSVNVRDTTNTTIEDIAWTHNQSTAYDGFSFVWTGTMTGTLCVYGLSQ